MERKIELELRMPDNKFKKFTADFVPYSKRHEYVRLEKELEAKAKKEKRDVTELEYEEIQTEFVASLFDEQVTKELIFDGLDTLDKTKIYEIIRYRVLGFSQEEDEKLKKALADKTLAGLNSTTSN